MKKFNDKAFRHAAHALAEIYAMAKDGHGPYQEMEGKDWRDWYATCRARWTRVKIVSQSPREASHEYGAKATGEFRDGYPVMALSRVNPEPMLRRLSGERKRGYYSNRNANRRTIRVYARLSRPQQRIVRRIQAMNSAIWDMWNCHA